MDRRRFIAGCALALSAAPQPVAGGNEQPVFRFVQWNDQHVDATSPPAYAKANPKQEYLISLIDECRAAERPAFVVSIGDMIHGEDRPSIQADLDVFSRLIANLRCGFYPVIGNHENRAHEGEPAWEEPFIDRFGKDRLNYTFEYGGVVFVAFNNTGAPSSNIRSNRHEWLQHTLSSTKGRPKILCCHIPLVPIRQAAVLGKSFGFASFSAQDEKLLGLIDSHADSIIAVLSGHLHLSGVVKRGGIFHIVASGVGSYPCHYATFDVYRDRICVRMKSLPDHLVTPETNIHGRPRYDLDFTDEDHPTHASYVQGTAAERVLDIPLSGEKKLT